MHTQGEKVISERAYRLEVEGGNVACSRSNIVEKKEMSSIIWAYTSRLKDKQSNLSVSKLLLLFKLCLTIYFIQIYKIISYI
jgi:hypothetical protein